MPHPSSNAVVPDVTACVVGGTNNVDLNAAVVSIGGTATSPFGRLRVAQPQTVFDSRLLHDKEPLLWAEVDTGGPMTFTYTQDRASVTIESVAAQPGTGTRFTKRSFPYEPGKGNVIIMTFVAGVPVAGGSLLVGQFDDEDGIRLRIDETGPSLEILSNVTGAPVINNVAQADWNIDTLDGSGGQSNPSGLTLDITKAQILLFDYQWLGVGSVRVGFVINGEIIYTHAFHHANIIDSVYMSSSNLPLAYENSDPGGVGGQTLECICCSVISEGGQDVPGKVFSANSGTTPVTGNSAAANYALLGVRLKTTHVDADVQVLNVSSLASTANDAFVWELTLNPNVAGTFTYAPLANTALEVAVGASANTVTGGTVLASGHVARNSNIDTAIDNAIQLGWDRTTRDTLVLSFRPITTPVDALGGLTWKEAVG